MPADAPSGSFDDAADGGRANVGDDAEGIGGSADFQDCFPAIDQRLRHRVRQGSNRFTSIDPRQTNARQKAWACHRRSEQNESQCERNKKMNSACHVYAYLRL